MEVSKEVIGAYYSAPAVEAMRKNHVPTLVGADCVLLCCCADCVLVFCADSVLTVC